VYRRLIILSVIISAALSGLAWLGYHSVQIWAHGMEGARLGEFAAVAEQIREDVKRKLDEFIEAELQRPYTEYLTYYVPDSALPAQAQMPLLRSPLAGKLEHGLAYGQFQIEPDGTITTPNDGLLAEHQLDQDPGFRAALISYKKNLESNLLPALSRFNAEQPYLVLGSRLASTGPAQRVGKQVDRKGESGQKGPGQFAGTNLAIESLQSLDEKTQIVQRNRAYVEQDLTSNAPGIRQHDSQAVPTGPSAEQAKQSEQAEESDEAPLAARDNAEPYPRVTYEASDRPSAEEAASVAASRQTNPGLPAGRVQRRLTSAGRQQEMVQVRIEPFVPVVVPTTDGEESIFGGQVFMLRHVQIEERHFIQGFKLNEKDLIKEVRESAARFMREGMAFRIARQASERSSYTAILDFGFGQVILNLMETDPGRLARQVAQLRYWYFSIIVVVVVAVAAGLASLWLNARAQLQLAQKKDDFISAVSHELRTPLTSIRMYSEMLEKNWVKSGEKAKEYHRNMRAESERLTRLVENILDFSRIQRGRKRYEFCLGDINTCVAGVVEMMRPYAAENGFTIKTQFSRVGRSAFDGDAVTQIVVNLLDNAVKYARNATEKTITVRTRRDGRFVLIEVEDHGPGVPHRDRKRIFEEFYRTGAESTRETTGAGLGLALVKRFAFAHNGFVEIATARPAGALFRVALAAQM